MKATEMLNKIKTFLGEETADIVNDVEAQEKVELATAKLDNGTVLEAEAFEAGQEVFIVTEDDKVALPVGDYTLEDGKMLVVAEEGIIAEIKDLDEEEAPADEEVEAEEEKEEMGYVTKEELAEAVSEIKAMIEDMKKEEMSEDGVELSEELPKEVKEELSEPAAEPIAHNPEQKNNNIGVKFAQNRKPSTLDKIMSKINN
jgi:hypothetical protein